ncbi:MAG: hypothetical protein WC373_04895 [Smithella sp.]|jgi:hypothetical protein
MNKRRRKKQFKKNCRGVPIMKPILDDVKRFLKNLKFKKFPTFYYLPLKIQNPKPYSDTAIIDLLDRIRYEINGKMNIQ